MKRRLGSLDSFAEIHKFNYVTIYAYKKNQMTA